MIGINNYEARPLDQAVADALTVTRALQDLGFDVSYERNPTGAEMKEIVRAYAASLTPGTTSVVYFAGHGFQIEGASFLAPKDFVATSALTANAQAFAVESLLKILRSANPGLSIVILDACRDNPFKLGRSLARGLGIIEAGEEEIIQYSTSDGEVAEDNGVFARVLARELLRKVEVDRAFKNIRKEVHRTARGQRPYTKTNTVIDYYLAGRPDAVVAEADLGDTFGLPRRVGMLTDVGVFGSALPGTSQPPSERGGYASGPVLDGELSLAFHVQWFDVPPAGLQPEAFLGAEVGARRWEQSPRYVATVGSPGAMIEHRTLIRAGAGLRVPAPNPHDIVLTLALEMGHGWMGLSPALAYLAVDELPPPGTAGLGPRLDARGIHVFGGRHVGVWWEADLGYSKRWIRTNYVRPVLAAKTTSGGETAAAAWESLALTLDPDELARDHVRLRAEVGLHVGVPNRVSVVVGLRVGVLVELLAGTADRATVDAASVGFPVVGAFVRFRAGVEDRSNIP